MLAALFLPHGKLTAQEPTPLTIQAEDSRGAAVAGAAIRDNQGHLLGVTGSDGQLSVSCVRPCRLRVEAEGFETQQITADDTATVRLAPAAMRADVTVTAYRTPLGVLESPVTTRLLTQQSMFQSGAITLDGQLRQLPGFELFRRTSALTANPSSQGMSLRGLGSTAASRTLVTRDEVPLNDPVGGWIHWDEQPELSIQSVEVVSGGASDLYGSSAIGGVVSIIPERPTGNEARLRSSWGAMNTYSESFLGQTRLGRWGLLGSGGALGTNGYVQMAPWLRGPVDQRSFVHAQNGVTLAEYDRGALRLFTLLSGFNESRGNGTAYQSNGTRLWRYAVGADWQSQEGASLAVRGYGSDEHFRQTFSSITSKATTSDPTCTSRCGETPTRYSLTPDNEVGGSVHWVRPLRAGLLLVAGGDDRDVRVWDREEVYTTGTAVTNLGVHQRDTGAYLEAMWVHRQWTWTASIRKDWFQTFDQRHFLWKDTHWINMTALSKPASDNPFNPRMGLSRKLGPHLSLSASGFRAFRSPTPNELYRSTQVGNKLTSPNGGLETEHATGWEVGAATEWNWGVVRASYFDTLVNRPIVAVTVNLTSSPILLLRENLGQLESKGVSAHFQIKPRSWLSADGGYQYAHATVTKGSQDVGNWIPEVARNMASLGVRASKPSWGLLRVQAKLSGRQYDDDANAYLLHGFVRFDAYGSRAVGQRMELFVSGENLADRMIEASRTPSTTLAMPRTWRTGISLRLGGAQKK